MDVIAIVAQKGGTGKTTLSVSLAVAAERDGLAAMIVDLDPQTTASRWGDRRETDSPVVVSAQPARLPRVLQAAADHGADLVLVDTPPRSEQASMAAVKASRHVLIPCRPAVYDLETIPTVLELLRYAGGGATVVLNGVPARGPQEGPGHRDPRRPGGCGVPGVPGPARGVRSRRRARAERSGVRASRQGRSRGRERLRVRS